MAGIVIRAGDCSVPAFRRGSESFDNGAGYMYGLSVNVTTKTNNKEDFWKFLTKDIKNYSHWGVAYLSDIEWARGKIRKAPKHNNQDHCLLSGPAKTIVSKFTRMVMPAP